MLFPAHNLASGSAARFPCAAISPPSGVPGQRFHLKWFDQPPGRS